MARSVSSARPEISAPQARRSVSVVQGTPRLDQDVLKGREPAMTWIGAVRQKELAADVTYAACEGRIERFPFPAHLIARMFPQ